MLRLLPLLLLVACGDKDSDDTSAPVDTDTDTVVDTDTDVPVADLFATEPVIASDAGCPLVPVLTATTDSDATVTVTEGGRTWSSATATTAPVLPMFDFVPDTDYTFTVTVTAGAETATRTVAWRSPSLPSAWPDVENLVSPPDPGMSPGFTLTALGSLGVGYHIAALDASGVPHWIFTNDSRVDDLDLDLNGNPLFVDADALHQLDWACSDLGTFTWDPAPVGAPESAVVLDDALILHHEVTQLSDGTFLTLSHELFDVDVFPTDYTLTDFDEATLDAAVILRFDGSGTVVDRISFADIYDQTRIGYDALNGGEADENGSYDWVHGNAVQWVEADDSYVVSARQQDAVVKFDRTTGQIQWILGNHDGWGAAWQPYLLDPLPGTTWPYHQHAPLLADDGSVVLFDNRNVAVSPPEPVPADYLPNSRAVQYRIDDVAMTVSQDWEYAETVVGPMFCAAGGSVEPLENGNMLVTCAYGQTFGTKLNKGVGHGESAVRLIEIDPATGDTLWDLHLFSDLAENDKGWNSARALRVLTVGPTGVGG